MLPTGVVARRPQHQGGCLLETIQGFLESLGIALNQTDLPERVGGIP